MKDRYAPELKGLTRTILFLGLLMVGVTLLYFIRPVFQVILSLFAAVLFSIFLNTIATGIRRFLPISAKLAVVATIFLFFAAVVISGWFVGTRIISESMALANKIPKAVTVIEEYLQEQGWAVYFLDNLPSPERLWSLGEGMFGGLSGVFSTTIGIFVHAFFILFAGIYFSLDPETYINGGLKLLPSERHDQVEEVLECVGNALRWWLFGRFVSMVVVGGLTTAGLIVVGLPGALTLGLLAGLLSFIPMLGPILSSIPPLLVALVGNPLNAVDVLLVVLVVQFLEGNLITPLVQRETVLLPPVVLVTAQIGFGLLLGVYGIFVATPATVVLLVIIQKVYVQDILGNQVRVLGTH